MTSTSKKINRGPVSIALPDGSIVVTETEITSYSDIRATPFGPMDFGHTHLGPQRLYIIDKDGNRRETNIQAILMLGTMTGASKKTEKKPTRRWWQLLNAIWPT